MTVYSARQLSDDRLSWAKRGASSMPSSEQLSTSSRLSDRTSHMGKRRDARKRPTGYEMISV
jgi:hypothetical protein